MNAQSPLTPLAVSAEPLLRALLADPSAPPKALAEAAGRHANHISRDLKALEAAGLISFNPTDLTVAGRAALAALDRVADDTPPGRGLLNPTPEGLVTLVWAQIFPDPHNPRRDFDSEEAIEALEELAQNIFDVGELLQNLVVRPHPDGGPTFMIVAGERRWRAIGMLIAKGAWAADVAIPVKIRTMSEAQARRWALIENLKRVDLKPMEEAVSFQQLVDSGMSTQEIALEVLGNHAKQRYVQQRIQLLDLDPESQRLIDAKQLTIKDALDLLRHGEIRPKDDAPRAGDVDLEPHQVLALVEIQAATRLRPAKDDFGPAATFDAYDFKLKDWPPEWELAQAGYIRFDQGRVVLLRPAQQHLARGIFAFIAPDERLRSAREHAGLDADAVAELERDELFDRNWLNERNPPPKLTPHEQLLLLELADAYSDKYSYRGAEVAGDAGADPAVRALEQRGLLRGPEVREHRTWLAKNWDAEKGLNRLCSGWDKKADRARHIKRLQDELGRHPAAGAKYVHTWLNGPFPLPPAAQAAIDAEAKTRTEQEQRAEDQRRRHEELQAQRAEAVARLEREIAEIDPEARVARFAEVLALIGAPAPWTDHRNRYYGIAQAANGHTIDAGDLTKVLLRIAINIAAGADLTQAQEPPAPADRAVFVGWIAERLQELLPAWKAERCRSKAGHALDDHLKADGGTEFGDADYDWGCAAAHEIAEGYADRLSSDEEREDGGPEENLEAADSGPDGDDTFTEDEEG